MIICVLNIIIVLIYYFILPTAYNLLLIYRTYKPLQVVLIYYCYITNSLYYVTYLITYLLAVTLTEQVRLTVSMYVNSFV